MADQCVQDPKALGSSKRPTASKGVKNGPQVPAVSNDDTGGGHEQLLSPCSPVVLGPSITGTTSRLNVEEPGKFMFLGASSNASLLRDVRRVARLAIGFCDFVDDAVEYQVADTPTSQQGWMYYFHNDPPPTPSLADATDLLETYFWATAGFLDLLEETDLRRDLPRWLDSPHGEGSSALSVIYFLIFAIGASSQSYSKDETTEGYYNYGRYLMAANFAHEPSVTAIQGTVLTTVYLMSRSCHNAAFMQIGTAVRSSYALGLHELKNNDTARKFTNVELTITSLGRPPGTSARHDEALDDNYSTAMDLCQIFQTILESVYATQQLSMDTLQLIGSKQRSWISSLKQGLARTKVGCEEQIECAGKKRFNLGLYHFKSGYNWSAILLTRPFVIEFASSYVSRASDDPQRAQVDNVAVCACVRAAVHNIELSQALLHLEPTAKRLPFVVNAVFVSALICGLAVFIDYDQIMPTQSRLTTAVSVLGHFQPHYAEAQRGLAIIQALERACEVYTNRRLKRRIELQDQMIAGIFGDLTREPLSSDVADPSTTDKILPVSNLESGPCDISSAILLTNPDHTDQEGQRDAIDELLLAFDTDQNAVFDMSPPYDWYQLHNEAILQPDHIDNDYYGVFPAL
ncbi:hypothetical protein VTL71DRAFT_9792 [Oculimacula yallundae]|uniref:Xylanolytic transcriptional activator regulatory domain-containing protein n=1 Tax=Oculimacula yallundae TaxID=86028 RepID=A0ABR4BRU5_9HELO